MKWILVLTLGLTAACGPLRQGNPVIGIAQGVTAGLFSSGESESPSESIAGAITREFIEAQPNEMMLVSVIAREATAIVVLGGNNGSKTTWFSEDGISVTFDNGVLVASRGLGDDLMGADMSGTKAAFFGSSNYLITRTYLDGSDQSQTSRFTCSMVLDRSEPITIYERTYDTQVYVETCENDEYLYRNSFWRTSDGTIWQARQWISADAGYLGYQRF